MKIQFLFMLIITMFLLVRCVSIDVSYSYEQSKSNFYEEHNSQNGGNQMFSQDNLVIPTPNSLSTPLPTPRSTLAPMPTPTPQLITFQNPEPRVGDLVHFGNFDWLVLDVQDDRMLIITENIISRRPYHSDWEKVTWETSAIRHYLNNCFYSKFHQDIRNRIIRVALQNNNNPWWNASGGNTTIDRIFLLSLEEVLLFFGDSGMVEKGIDVDNRNIYLRMEDKGISIHRIHDEYSNNRIAYLGIDETDVWWLRTPGADWRHVANVSHNGAIDILGWNAISSSGVRPALWLCLNEDRCIDEYVLIKDCKRDTLYKGERSICRREQSQENSIQNLFEPIEFYIFHAPSSSFPLKFRMYPFGEIVSVEEYYRASFVIFFDTHRHTIYENSNLLRFTREFVNGYIMFEITQISNITVDEAIRKFKAKHDFNRVRASPYTFFHQPTINSNSPFHVIGITVFDSPIGYFVYTEGEVTYVDEHRMTIRIRDNNRGGVFVLTTHIPFFHYILVSYSAAIDTFVILD